MILSLENFFLSTRRIYFKRYIYIFFCKLILKKCRTVGKNGDILVISIYAFLSHVHKIFIKFIQMIIENSTEAFGYDISISIHFNDFNFFRFVICFCSD